MAKAKFVLSPADKLSILIATIALISTFFTIYIQFFYRTTNLQVGSVSIAQAQDSLSKSLDIDVLFLNSGTNPVAFTKWHSFLSADKSLTKGTCYSNMINLENTALYSYGCDTNINEVIEPNTAEFVKLNLVINKNTLQKYIQLNNGDNNSLFKVGVYLKFVDSNGKTLEKELVIGMVKFGETNSAIINFTNPAEDLVIY